MALASASQLLDALSSGDFELSEQLLKEGADPNEVLPVEGVAPMHIAAGLSGQTTRLLLQYKGNPNVRSVEGTTPMHVACIWGKKDVLVALLQHGGDPFIKDQDGETAFGSAAKFTQQSCLEALKLHMSEDLSSSSSTLKELLTKDKYCMDVTSPDHPYIDVKGRKTDTLEDSFQTCTSHCDACTCNQLDSVCLEHKNSPRSNFNQAHLGQGDHENCVYEVFKNAITSPTRVSVNPVNLSDLITSDESFCAENDDSLLKQFSNIDIRSPRRRKIFTPPVTLPSSLPANLSDLMTSDESFVPPSKVSFAKSLNNLALNSPSKKDFVKQWHQQNFPLATHSVSSTLQQSGNSSDLDNTIPYDPYEDLDKTLPYSIDSISLGSTGESTIHYWEDPVTGSRLIEKHIPSSFCGSSGRPSINTSICSHSTVDSQRTELYDWTCYSKLSSECNVLTNNEIRKKLQSLGDDPGPVIPSTRQTYLTRLKHLETNVKCGQLGITKKLPDYPSVLSAVLSAAIDGRFDVQGLREMGEDLMRVFNDKSLSCNWREGTVKSSFNYLLLDPRITQDLPNRADNLGELETFQIFVGAIFYIGKGKRSRPYCHLFEALPHLTNQTHKVGSKVKHILDIWNDGQGVVSLHCFQSVIPVEAYTREACMVEAIGLPRLTNIKRGDFYGPATSWSSRNRQRFGVYLLKKALQIFLGEGERQISPQDIRK